MDISRQMFGWIIDSQKKIAGALRCGKALKIEGGEVKIGNMKRFRWRRCNWLFEDSWNTEKPIECPKCNKR